MKKLFPKTNYYVLQYPNGKYVASPGNSGLIYTDIPSVWLFDLKVYQKRSDAIFDRDNIRAFNKCKILKLHILV